MKVIDLAKDIVFLCRKFKYEYNHTKVQKLLFLFVGFALMNNIRPEEEILLVINGKVTETDGIVDEQPKAWPYGPIFSKVSNAFVEIEEESSYDPYYFKTINEKSRIILTETVKKYGRVSSGQLSEWLQKSGSPWDSVKQIDGTGWSIEIPLDVIREYFENSIENVVDVKKVANSATQTPQQQISRKSTTNIS